MDISNAIDRLRGDRLPDDCEALLAAETGGIAPSPLGGDGTVVLAF
ncbi:hypothetical protein ACFQX7_36145 [Luedemannella flava]